MSSMSDDIKKASNFTDEPHVPDTQKADILEQHEVFKKGDGQIDFRTVSWIRAGVIFLKSKGLWLYRVYSLAS